MSNVAPLREGPENPRKGRSDERATARFVPPANYVKSPALARSLLDIIRAVGEREGILTKG
jgi:hypothetical protein